MSLYVENLKEARKRLLDRVAEIDKIISEGKVKTYILKFGVYGKTYEKVILAYDDEKAGEIAADFLRSANNPRDYDFISLSEERRLNI